MKHQHQWSAIGLESRLEDMEPDAVDVVDESRADAARQDRSVVGLRSNRCRLLSRQFCCPDGWRQRRESLNELTTREVHCFHSSAPCLRCPRGESLISSLIL